MKILLHRHSQNNYQIWLYKVNLMCEELSYQIIHTSAVNQAPLLLLKVCKNHYKKENIIVGNSDWRRDAGFFWIHLRQTWLNLFGLILAALSFSTFIFLIGIKLFIWHPVALFDFLILLELVNDFVEPSAMYSEGQVAMSSYILEILSSISHYRLGKTNQMQDMILIRIRLLLQMEAADK